MELNIKGPWFIESQKEPSRSPHSLALSIACTLAIIIPPPTSCVAEAWVGYIFQGLKKETLLAGRWLSLWTRPV